ncbi:MAG: glycosyltransferase family 2 protein [Clostridia bacterium]|nr:glycosyltransferase family 2 protein [Clostridia bacterium]
MLGIVMLNYKNYTDVFPCIESIRDTIGDIAYKIYLVDNASPNESVAELTKAYAQDIDVEIIAHNENGGFSAGNNVGFKRAIADGCDTLLCTNSDVKYFPNTIRIMFDRLWLDEKCGVVGPKVYKKDGSIQNCNKGTLTASTFIVRRRAFRFLDWTGKEKKYTYADYDYSAPLYPTGMVSGCCFMVKAKVMEEIGYLDEHVFLYHEEDILGAKMRHAGLYVVLEPSAELIHYEGQSTGGVSPFTRYCTFYSGLYYLWKYSDSSTFAVSVAGLCIRLMMWLYSLRAKEYRPYCKRLKQELVAMKKIKRGI